MSKNMLLKFNTLAPTKHHDNDIVITFMIKVEEALRTKMTVMRTIENNYNNIDPNNEL